MKPLDLAILFHEIFEKLAPSFGYTTREESKIFDANSTNGKLMIATCKEVLHNLNKIKIINDLRTCEKCGTVDGSISFSFLDNTFKETTDTTLQANCPNCQNYWGIRHTRDGFLKLLTNPQ